MKNLCVAAEVTRRLEGEVVSGFKRGGKVVGLETLAPNESGRGLAALQDAVAPFPPPEPPPGFGVRPVLCRFWTALVIAFALTFAIFAKAGEAKKIVFVAGPPSHGPGQHEHRAGCLLLEACVDKIPGFSSVVYSNGWPADARAFDGASSIVLYMDGGPGHPALQDDRLQTLGALMKKGVGLACIHYATEPTKEKGEKEFLEWTGGAFEVDWSVNPHWDAEFKTLPDHPITRGVKPFTINDEWYFHIRFPEGMKGVTPILSAVAPESTMSRKDGAHEGNSAVRESVKKGELQCVSWARQRPDGGRGFGFTGAHFHHNWDNPNFRRLVLNAIVWTARGDVPEGGIESTVTKEQLEENLDPKGRQK